MFEIGEMHESQRFPCQFRSRRSRPDGMAQKPELERREVQPIGRQRYEKRGNGAIFCLRSFCRALPLLVPRGGRQLRFATAGQWGNDENQEPRPNHLPDEPYSGRRIFCILPVRGFLSPVNNEGWLLQPHHGSAHA